MELQCEHCGDIYSTNTMLYRHKQTAHPNSIVLNDHHVKNDSTTQGMKRTIIDNIDNCNQSKCKISKVESNSTAEEEIDGKTVDFTVKPILKVETYSKDNPAQKLRGQLSGKSSITDTFNTDKSMRGNITNGTSSKKVTKTEKLDENDLTKIMKGVYETKIVQKLNNDLVQLKQKHHSEITQIQKNHGTVLAQLEMKYKNEKSLYKDRFNSQTTENITISDDDDDDEEIISELSKIIFKYNTMSEIFEIQRLMESSRVNEAIQKYFPTFKNLLLSLIYGIIPLCQPQRDQVTDNQRDLVEKLQYATKQTAKKLLKNRHSEIIKLFTIVKDSIKLVRDSYNKYGIVIEDI